MLKNQNNIGVFIQKLRQARRRPTRTAALVLATLIIVLAPVWALRERNNAESIRLQKQSNARIVYEKNSNIHAKENEIERLRSSALGRGSVDQQNEFWMQRDSLVERRIKLLNDKEVQSNESVNEFNLAEKKVGKALHLLATTECNEGNKQHIESVCCWIEELVESHPGNVRIRLAAADLRDRFAVYCLLGQLAEEGTTSLEMADSLLTYSSQIPSVFCIRGTLDRERTSTRFPKPATVPWFALSISKR